MSDAVDDGAVAVVMDGGTEHNQPQQHQHHQQHQQRPQQHQPADASTSEEMAVHATAPDPEAPLAGTTHQHDQYSAHVPDPTVAIEHYPQPVIHPPPHVTSFQADPSSLAPVSAARIVTAGEDASDRIGDSPPGNAIESSHNQGRGQILDEVQPHDEQVYPHEYHEHQQNAVHIHQSVHVIDPSASAIAAAAAAVAQQQHHIHSVPVTAATAAAAAANATLPADIDIRSVPTPLSPDPRGLVAIPPPAATEMVTIPENDMDAPATAAGVSIGGQYAYELTDRDVLIDASHFSNHTNASQLLSDLICLHRNIRQAAEESQDALAKGYSIQDDDELARRLAHLMYYGKTYELAGIKAVPKQFLTGRGRFFKRDNLVAVEATEEEAYEYVKSLIKIDEQIAAGMGPDNIYTPISSVMNTSGSSNTSHQNSPHDDSRIKHIATAILEKMQPKTKNELGEPLPIPTNPRQCDVLFHPAGYTVDDTVPFEQQTGNKVLLQKASQLVSVDTDSSPKRVHAAQKLITTQTELPMGNEIYKKNPMYIVQSLHDDQTIWKEMTPTEISEFAVIFVFEIFLEKQIHGAPPLPAPFSARAKGRTHADLAGPSGDPINSPTPHDVLFGRGGMTNNHQGNRRFRDIIALHRPDYIRATKMEKPNVARKIVRAIRQGNPPGRFLKKGDDNLWYDVGDRCAAEKTSQGLRERTNVEKRQRSMNRESLRGNGESGSEMGDQSPLKRVKLEHSESITDQSAASTPSASAYTGAVAHPMGMSPMAVLPVTMKEKPREGNGIPSALSSRSVVVSAADASAGVPLPPLAVDENGDILMTDHDILCGRGGLTNHHKGNKRYRDIVTLHRPDYIKAAKIQKPAVAKMIVRAIRTQDPPGRFLKKNEKTGKWVDIGDKRAAEKTSQALREKGNNEKSGREVSSGLRFTSPAAYYPPMPQVAMPHMMPVGHAGTIPIQPYPHHSQAVDSMSQIAPQATSQETMLEPVAGQEDGQQPPEGPVPDQGRAIPSGEEDTVTAEVVDEEMASNTVEIQQEQQVLDEATTQMPGSKERAESALEFHSEAASAPGTVSTFDPRISEDIEAAEIIASRSSNDAKTAAADSIEV